MLFLVTSLPKLFIVLQIPDIEKIIPDLRERSTSLLFSETNDEILGSMERFQIKIIAYEHMYDKLLTFCFLIYSLVSGNVTSFINPYLHNIGIVGDS